MATNVSIYDSEGVVISYFVILQISSANEVSDMKDILLKVLTYNFVKPDILF
jgi:hypothetical protein